MWGKDPEFWRLSVLQTPDGPASGEASYGIFTRTKMLKGTILNSKGTQG